MYLQIAALTIGLKNADFYKVPVLSGSDQIPLCKLKGDLPDPAIPDFSRLL